MDFSGETNRPGINVDLNFDIVIYKILKKTVGRHDLSDFHADFAVWDRYLYESVVSSA